MPTTIIPVADLRALRLTCRCCGAAVVIPLSAKDELLFLGSAVGEQYALSGASTWEPGVTRAGSSTPNRDRLAHPVRQPHPALETRDSLATIVQCCRGAAQSNRDRW